jgi:TonB family protein
VGWALNLTPAMSVELPSAGGLVRIPCGEMVFEIDAAAPQERLPRPWLAPGFRREGAFLLAAAAVFAAGVAALFAIPADPKALSLDDVERSRRMVRMLIVPPAAPPEAVAARGATQSLPASGGGGGAPAGPAGRAGDRRARPVPGRLAVRGPADNVDPRLIARQLAERIAHTGILGQLRAEAGSALASVLADGPALGRDADTVLATLDSANIAAAYGSGGLSDRGTGAYGADTGEHALGVGVINTLGRYGGGPGPGGLGPGGPGGPGFHYGTRAGELGTRRARTPSFTPGPPEVRGSLDREIVRRIVRRHLNEVRYCYEGELVRRPALAGRLVVQFAIAATGQVISSVVQSSTLGEPRVESCVTQAVRRWEFPQPHGGGLVMVSYPFQLQPAGGL